MNPRWPNGAIPRYKQSPVSGPAEPAPPRCGPSQLGWPCGGRPGSDARGRFLGGMRSARPEIRAGPKPGHVMIVGGWAKRPMAKRRRARVGVMRCLRACGARPSAVWAIPTRMALRRKARGWRERRFSRRDALRASANTGRTQNRGMSPSPGHRREHGGQKTAHSGWRDADITGVRSPPLRGEANRNAGRLAGKPESDAKSDFLGGARSPRPHCEAVGMPRHNIIIGGKRTPGGQMGTCSGEANSVLAGVRSPPLPRVDDQN
jgi:hypothetical protein